MMRKGGVGTDLRHLQLLGLCEHPTLAHGFSTRRGGTSSPPFSSLNLSLEVGDHPDSVRENRSRLLGEMGIEGNPLVKVKQVHGDEILVIDQGRLSRPDFPECLSTCPADALITRIPGLILAVSVADCVPILLYDPKSRVIAAIHGGWRSTASGLAAKVVRRMSEVFGTQPEDCVAAIGPSIRSCCYQVDEPVIEAFARLSPRWRDWVQEKGRGRAHLDLCQANRDLLQAAGVPGGAIHAAEHCTSCRTDLFFSHRRDGGRTGRMMGLIMMRTEDDEH